MMRISGYIWVVYMALVGYMASSCIKDDVVYGDSRSDITIAPVTSLASRSVPGPVTGTTYPVAETMGIMAYHNLDCAPGEWTELNSVSEYISKGEFKYNETYATWAGWLDGAHYPYHWPDAGSLIFAGFSPYYKFEYSDADKLKPIEDMVSFDVASRTFSITDYKVGTYVPMSREDIQNPDVEYVNKAQSDLMFFLPSVLNGKYIGVNRLSSFPARFYHALSMVEFTVRAEDDFDIDRVDLSKVTLENVYSGGDFSAKLKDDGSFSAEWTGLELDEDVDVFHDEANIGLELDLEPRTIAQLLIIPGPAHPVEVVCHIHINDKLYTQTFEMTPEEVGIRNWEMGKRYVYNLILGINKITFSPDTYEWNDVDGGNGNGVINY